jgi:hypothetical protein
VIDRPVQEAGLAVDGSVGGAEAELRSSVSNRRAIAVKLRINRIGQSTTLTVVRLPENRTDRTRPALQSATTGAEAFDVDPEGALVEAKTWNEITSLS